MGYGQNKIDSLQNPLSRTDDSVSVEVLNELSKSLNYTLPRNSLKYAIEAKQIATELDDLAPIGKSINYIGVSYYYLNGLNLSNESYFEALSIFDSEKYHCWRELIILFIARYFVSGLEFVQIQESLG